MKFGRGKEEKDNPSVMIVGEEEEEAEDPSEEVKEIQVIETEVVM